MSDIPVLKSLAPRVCLRCETRYSFVIHTDKLVCRHCGYTISRDDSQSVTAASMLRMVAPGDLPRFQPDRPLRASYHTSHIGPVDTWARAAFDTAIDHIRREEWDEAAASFQRAIDRQHDFIDPYLWLSRLATDPVVKREHLETVLAHQPHHLEAVRELMVLDGKLSAQAMQVTEYTEPELRSAGGAVGTETENVRCPTCGSIRFAVDEATGLPVCTACGYVAETAPNRSTEQGLLTLALLERRAQPVKWVIGERLLACDTCGAERTIPARKLSQECPFCASTHVIERDVLDSFQQPDGMIAFTVRQEDAQAAVYARLGGWMERFKGWLDNNTVRRMDMQGVYLPFWLFDAGVEVRITIIREPEYNKNTWNYVPGDLYTTSTTLDAINDVAVCAVKSPPLLLTSRLGDYDLSKVKGYDRKLLAQYPAELYSIDFDKASLEARGIISRKMREKHSLLTSAPSDAKVNISSSVRGMQFQLLLLPVWVATLHEEDGDLRTALVNGQTGRVVLGKARKPRTSRRRS